MTEAAHVIQISDLQAFCGIAVMLLGIGIAYGSLKRGMQTVEDAMQETSKLLHSMVIPQLTDVRERFIVVEHRVEMLWRDKFTTTHTFKK